MIASSYTAVADAAVRESSVVTRHRVRIQRHIEDHLRQLDLIPTSHFCRKLREVYGVALPRAVRMPLAPGARVSAEFS
jgi:hypothetical protein